MMSALFTETHIKSLKLTNRFLRSATWEGMADSDGSCPSPLCDIMVQLAVGGVGLIITGHAYVSQEGQAGPWQIGIHRDEMVPGLTRMADAVHGAGGKIAVQLAHAGCYAYTGITGREAMGPSGVEAENVPPSRVMSKEDIRSVVTAFGKAAARAKQAGFDGVQVHAAHGYLLSEFLSPFFNRRTDQYGGPVENRARLLLEVLHSVRKAVGKDYPVMVKLNSEDFITGGLTVDDMLRVAELLQEAGVDAIELSGGTIFASGRFSAIRQGDPDTPDKEVYYRLAAERFKQRVSVPLMLVGGIRSFAVAEELVGSGTADYISLCRPLIREPGLINRWRNGDRQRTTCLSDNSCFGPLRKGEGLFCPLDRQ